MPIPQPKPLPPPVQKQNQVIAMFAFTGGSATGIKSILITLFINLLSFSPFSIFINKRMRFTYLIRIIIPTK